MIDAIYPDNSPATRVLPVIVELPVGMAFLITAYFYSQAGIHLSPYVTVLGGAFVADGMARLVMGHGIEYVGKFLERK